MGPLQTMFKFNLTIFVAKELQFKNKHTYHEDIICSFAIFKINSNSTYIGNTCRRIEAFWFNCCNDIIHNCNLIYRHFGVLQACRVPSSVWSKIGRLKRATMPKLTKGSSVFGSGASPGIMSCIAGRLLCDTYLCSRDLLKEV